jgi:hypothetical protein
MDYREKSFQGKFSTAARCLNARPDQIVSLKFRENVDSYNDYRDLLDMLQREAGIQYSEVDGDLQGRGYIVTFGTDKLVLVEHETGLEILYIASSVASLLGLIPLVTQGWAAIRRRLSGRHMPTDGPVEIRRIDQEGRLHEESLHDRQLSASLLPTGALAPAVMAAATLMENEIKYLVRQIEELTCRVDAMEKKTVKGNSIVKRKPSGPKMARSKSEKGSKQAQKKS